MTGDPTRSCAGISFRASLRPARLAAVVVVGVLSVLLASRLALSHGSFDLRVYHGAVSSWLDGGDLYAFGLGSRRLGFTYPPFAAICMTPMALLPVHTVTIINQLVVVASVVITSWLVVQNLPWLRARGELFAVALLVPMAFVLQPVRDTLTFGQVNILLAALVLLDLWAQQRDRRWAGVGIGLATAIKLTPGLFVVLLLVVGARRAAATAIGTAVAATLLAAAVAPGTSWDYWTSEVFDSSRVGSFDSASNQSLAGLLARLVNSGQPPLWWLPLVLLLLAYALRAARSLWEREERLAAFTVVGLTAALCSPISWVHHLWWVLPAVLLVIDTGLRRRSRALLGAGIALACVYASGLPDLTRAAPREHHTWPALLGENAYAVGLLLLVLVLPGLRRHEARVREAVIP